MKSGRKKLIDIRLIIRDNVTIVNKVSTLLILLLLILASCGGDGNNECTLIENESNYLLIFQGCPNNGLKDVCNSFDCVFTPQFTDNPPPPELFLVLNPRDDCTRIDRCVNLDCVIDEGEILLSTLEFLPGNVVVGAANINGLGPYDFTCDIILP